MGTLVSDAAAASRPRCAVGIPRRKAWPSSAEASTGAVVMAIPPPKGRVTPFPRWLPPHGGRPPPGGGGRRPLRGYNWFPTRTARSIRRQV